MSMAEIFLLVWAGVATTLAVLYRNGGKNLFTAHRHLSVLLAEVVTGEVVPTKDSNGVWTVENEDMCMQFKTKEVANGL
jgi:hypothetical protein